MVDLPMPGGPESSAALAPGFSLACAGFLRPLGSPRWHFSQSSSHCPSFLHTSPFPSKSFIPIGMYLSAHNPESTRAGGRCRADEDAAPPPDVDDDAGIRIMCVRDTRHERERERPGARAPRDRERERDESKREGRNTPPISFGASRLSVSRRARDAWLAPVAATTCLTPAARRETCSRRQTSHRDVQKWAPKDTRPKIRALRCVQRYGAVRGDRLGARLASLRRGRRRRGQSRDLRADGGRSRRVSSRHTHTHVLESISRALSLALLSHTSSNAALARVV